MRRETYELSAGDLGAKLWYELRIRSFSKIARLTRHQIADILCREVDAKTGRVETHGMPERRKKSVAGPDGEHAPRLSDWPSIFRYVKTRHLQEQGWEPEAIGPEVERLFRETPVGRAQQVGY